MIRILALMLAKALLESAVILLAVAAILMMASFRIGRRLVTTSDDPLERLSGRAAQLNALIPRRVAQEDNDD